MQINMTVFAFFFSSPATSPDSAALLNTCNYSVSRWYGCPVAGSLVACPSILKRENLFYSEG